MKREGIVLKQKEFRTVLLPRLRGRVFHVTCHRTLPAIFHDGGVRANNGSFESAFPSAANSYYKQHGCICVFDYRNIDDGALQDSLLRCSPYDAVWRCRDHLAILFLSENAVEKLDKSATLSSRLMFVPHVEAGYPNTLFLADIDEVLEVKVERETQPDSNG